MTMIIWNVILYNDVNLHAQNRVCLSAHMKPMSQGTKRSPAHLKMDRNALRNGAPKANATAQPLTKSATNKPGVVLLNPCFSSNTKVE